MGVSTGRYSQYYFLYIFLFGHISFCILVCFLPRNIFVEEDVLL